MKFLETVSRGENMPNGDRLYSKEIAMVGRPRKDGSGKGVGQPDGGGRNKNTQPCPEGGPSRGAGGGKGGGKNRK